METSTQYKVTHYVGKSSDGSLVNVSVRWDIPGGTVANWAVLRSGKWEHDRTKWDLIWNYQKRRLSDVVLVRA